MAETDPEPRAPPVLTASASSPPPDTHLPLPDPPEVSVSASVGPVVEIKADELSELLSDLAIDSVKAEECVLEKTGFVEFGLAAPLPSIVPDIIYEKESVSAPGPSHSRKSSFGPELKIPVPVGGYTQQGIAKTATNEDRLVIIPEIGTIMDPVQYVAVFDGHGGPACAEFMKQRMHEFIMATPAWEEKDYAKALSDGFKNADLVFLQDFPEESSGACAVVALLTPSRIYVGHVGDCRAILFTKDQTIMQTRDHKAGDPIEKLRIEAAGGLVVRDRVFGMLAVSRSLGDKDLKGIVGADPEVDVWDVHIQHELLILGSDGIWDMSPSKKVANYCRRKLKEDRYSIDRTAEALVKSAVTKGTKDDTTAVVCQLRKLTRSAPSTPKVKDSAAALNAFEQILGYRLKSDMKDIDDMEKSFKSSFGGASGKLEKGESSAVEEEVIGDEIDLDDDDEGTSSTASSVPSSVQAKFAEYAEKLSKEEISEAKEEAAKDAAKDKSLKSRFQTWSGPPENDGFYDF